MHYIIIIMLNWVEIGSALCWRCWWLRSAAPPNSGARCTPHTNPNFFSLVIPHEIKLKKILEISSWRFTRPEFEREILTYERYDINIMEVDDIGPLGEVRELMGTTNNEFWCWVYWRRRFLLRFFYRKILN